MKLLALLVIGGLFLVTGLSTDAFAVNMIKFDDKPDFTTITNDYQTDGVIFSSTSYTLQILDDSGEAPPGPPSNPNILVSNYGSNNGVIIINVVDPMDFSPTDASSISFYLYSVGNNKVTVVAKDSLGNPVNTKEFQHNDVGGPNCTYPSRFHACPGPIENGWGQTDLYTFSGPIRTVTITSSQATTSDGYGIDNVLVEFTTTQAVAGELLPLDSTALFVSGITSSVIWMIPTVVSASAIGYLAIRKII